MAQSESAEAGMRGGDEAEDEHVIVVQCPEGTGPGDMLLVEAEDGLEIEAEVPAGIKVGQEFEVNAKTALAKMERKKKEAAELAARTEGAAPPASSPRQTAAEEQGGVSSPEESLANESGVRGQTGRVWLQRSATADFEPLWMELSDTALSFKRFEDEPGVIRVASVESCTVRVPKTPRHGRPYAFRLDLASKDSMGDARYVLAAEHFSDLQGWLMKLSDACVDGVDRTLKLLSDRGLDSVGVSDDAGEIVVKERQFQLTVQKNYVVKKTTSLALNALVLVELELRLQKKLNLPDRICIELLDEDFEEKAAVMSLDDLPEVCQIYVQLGEKRPRPRSRVNVDPESQRIKAQHEIMALKETQLQAMQQEDYEDCALLRDAMRLLEDGLQAAESVVSSKKRPESAAAPAGLANDGTDVPDQLEGSVESFERLAKPLLPNANQDSLNARTPTGARPRTSTNSESRRGRPRSPNTRGISPTQRRARSPALEPSVSALLADLPEPTARTNRTAPLSKIQQSTLIRLVDAIETLQKNLRSLSYDHGGQNVRKLFNLFDIRRTDRLTVKEFTASVRKGGKIKLQQMNVGEVNELFRVICVKDEGELACPEFASFVWRAKPEVLAEDVIAGVDSKGRPRKKKGEGPNRDRKPLRQGYDDGAEAHKRRVQSPRRMPRPHIVLADRTRPMMDPLDWTTGTSNPQFMQTQPALFGSRKRDHAENAHQRSRSLRVQALVSPPRGARAARRAAAADGQAAEYHGTEGYRAGFATPKKAEWRTKPSPRVMTSEDGDACKKKPRAAAKEQDEKWRAKVDSYTLKKLKREEAREERDKKWRAKVDGYDARRKEMMKARTEKKLNLDSQRLERDLVHKPSRVHKTPKTNAELEALTTRLSSPFGRERMKSTMQTLEKKHEEVMTQHSKVKTVSQKKAAELAAKLTNQGTVEPRSLRTRPEDYEHIKREKRIAEYSVRLSSPERSLDGVQSFTSLDAMKGVGARQSPQRSRSPSGRRKLARSPQLRRFLERQQEAIDLQRANLLQKKALLLEEEKARMNSSKLATTVGKADRQRAMKLRSPPRSVTIPRQGYSRSPMHASAGSPARSQATPVRSSSSNSSSGIATDGTARSSPRVAVVGEVVTTAGVTESGATVPVVKARIRQVDPDELSSHGGAGGSPRVLAIESVSSWSSGLVPEEEERDADIAAAATDASPGRLQDSVEARVAAAVAEAAASPPVEKGFALPGREERNALFDRFDANGNGGLSLAEIDKAVVELWPHFDHKRALMRAYKAADANGDGLIKRREFRLLLKYIVYFHDLWDTFEALDANHDHRLSQSEFQQGVLALNMKLGDEEVGAAFEAMDIDGGGYVLFDEFCGWCAKAMVSAEVEEVEAQVTAAVEAEEAAKAAAQNSGKVDTAADALTAVAAVVEAEILADDGLISSPSDARPPTTSAVMPAGTGRSTSDSRGQQSDAITLNDDDEFVTVVCPEGLKPGDMIVISHPDTGEDVEGEVPEGITPGDEFEIFIG